MPSDQRPVWEMRWLDYTNGGAEPIPAFGLVRITGAEQGVFTGAQPDTDGQEVWVNGPSPVAAGASGACTRDWPAAALYDEDYGEPQPGQEWGAAAGSHKLRPGLAGFRMLGGVDAGRVLVETSKGGGGGGGGIFVGEADLNPYYPNVGGFLVDQTSGLSVVDDGQGTPVITANFSPTLAYAGVSLAMTISKDLIVNGGLSSLKFDQVLWDFNSGLIDVIQLGSQTQFRLRPGLLYRITFHYSLYDPNPARSQPCWLRFRLSQHPGVLFNDIQHTRVLPPVPPGINELHQDMIHFDFKNRGELTFVLAADLLGNQGGTGILSPDAGTPCQIHIESLGG